MTVHRPNGASDVTSDGPAAPQVPRRGSSFALIALSILVAALVAPLVQARSVRALPRRQASATTAHTSTPGSRRAPGREWFAAAEAPAAGSGAAADPL